jgi:hypothetical protein
MQGPAVFIDLTLEDQVKLEFMPNIYLNEVNFSQISLICFSRLNFQNFQ